MTTNASDATDVLVIGSGIGGLSTGIVLARSGYRVTVIEKNILPGGLMRGYSRHEIECDVGVHYLCSLGEGQVLRRLFDFLEVSRSIPVQRMGQDGVIDRYLFDDFCFDLPEGLDAYAANLIAAFPDEKRQIDDIMQGLRSAARRLNHLDFLDPEHPEKLSWDQFTPLGEFLSRIGCSPRLRAVLSVPANWIGVSPEECPMMYHHMALSSYLLSSWRLENGGAQMADAFSERFQELGGRLILGDAASEIHVDARTVQGIRLRSGRVLSAPVVVGAIHPKTVIGILPESSEQPLYRSRITGLADTRGFFCVHAEVDAASHSEIPHNLFAFKSDQTGNIVSLIYYQIRKTRKPGSNLLTILTSGNTGFWMRWKNSRSGHRGPDYLKAKTDRGMMLIREYENRFGRLIGMKYLDAYTPLTIRDWVNSPNGSAYGVSRSYTQMLATAMLNRTPIKGLFLAGQSVMAPGILGTIIGSLTTALCIMGPEAFQKTVIQKINHP